MTPATSQNQSILSAFSDAELTSLVQEIVDSGELGRSKVYGSLLLYLVAASKSKKRVKEIEIAIDVLGKPADFDISRNAAVRVCVHQLRKKLNNFYSNNNRTEEFRLLIPTGYYGVEATPLVDTAAIDQQRSNRFGALIQRERLVLLSIAALLLANLLYLATTNSSPSKANAIAANSNETFWSDMLEDNTPILLVMGEYQLYGNSSATTDIQRLMLEFNSDSLTSQDNLPLSNVLTTENYLDLDLSYMPEGSAYVLANIVPLLQKQNKPVNVTMMGDLTEADLESNHIFYVGYIGALDKLSTIMFAASGLQIGRSLDELVNLETQEVYTSTIFKPEEGEPFHDYGLFSTFSTENNHRVVIAAGMRDAGLMQVGQVLADTRALGNITYELPRPDDEHNYEALFEVFGNDTMNFNSRMVYSGTLELNKLWRRGITGLTKEGIGSTNTSNN